MAKKTKGKGKAEASPSAAARRKRRKARLFGAALGGVVFGVAGVLLWRAGFVGDGGGARLDGPSELALGREAYDAQCASCHGANLEGQPNWRRRLPSGELPAPPHDATGHTWHHPDPWLFAVTKYGTLPFAPPGYVSTMRGFADELTDREIQAVLAYIQTYWPAEIRARQAEITRRFRKTQ